MSRDARLSSAHDFLSSPKPQNYSAPRWTADARGRAPAGKCCDAWYALFDRISVCLAKVWSTLIMITRRPLGAELIFFVGA